MALADLATRLGNVAELGGRISGALELSALTASGQLPPVCPCAFVMQMGLDARPVATATGLHRQMMTERHGVVLVINTPDDPDGAGSISAVETLSMAVISLVAGWQPPAATGVYSLVRARLLDLAQGHAFYQIDFDIPSQLRVTP